MPSHRMLAVTSLVALFSVASVAGCPGDPGTFGPDPFYGTSSSSGTGGTGGTGGMGGTGGIGGTGGTPCECGPGLECCDLACIDLSTDVLNCGVCGTVCPGPFPYCDNGVCGQWPCSVPDIDCETGICCDGTCCDPESGDICCPVSVNGMSVPTCVPASEGACPHN